MTRNVTVIGTGYSAQRFARAFIRSGQINDELVDVSLLARKDVEALRRSPNDLNRMIRNADVVINATNDDQHANVFDVLREAEGFVVWEKPLLAPSNKLEEPTWPSAWMATSQFGLNCIERYSRAVESFHETLRERDLHISRINFTWAKNRFDDPRPTVGIVSEIVHPLDMVCYLTGEDPARFNIHKVSTVASDYRSQPGMALESASVVAQIQKTVVTGYSSFAHPGRRRVFEITLVNPRGGREYAEITFDEPVWDRDRYHHWSDEEDFRDEWITSAHPGDPETCGKLTRFASDVLFSSNNRRFTTLREARSLQRVLNAIQAVKGVQVEYGRGSDRHIMSGSDLERLG